MRLHFRAVWCVSLALTLSACAAASAQGTRAYLDPAQPIEKRVADLVGRMTLQEKAECLFHNSWGVPRLKIPASADIRARAQVEVTAAAPRDGSALSVQMPCPSARPARERSGLVLSRSPSSRLEYTPRGRPAGSPNVAAPHWTRAGRPWVALLDEVAR